MSRARDTVLGCLALLWLAPAVPGAELSWTTSYSAGLRRARQEERPAIVDFHSESCGWCRLMERESYADAQVVATLTNYVCIKVDVGEDAETAMAFGIQSVPRTVIINRRGDVVGDHIGYLPVERFREILGAAAEYENASPEGAEPAPGLEQTEALAELEESFKDGAEIPAARVLEFLAHRDPGLRAEVSRLLLADREKAVPLLVEALVHPYLGVRIAAGDLLREFDEGFDVPDPWAPASGRVADLLRSRERFGLPALPESGAEPGGEGSE